MILNTITVCKEDEKLYLGNISSNVNLERMSENVTRLGINVLNWEMSNNINHLPYYLKLSFGKINSKLVWNCHQSLMTLGEHSNVQLLWVPGHEKIERNTIPD
jgi:hypothetical protein